MDHATFCKSLREVADFYEKHPECPLPYLSQLDAFVETKEEITAVAKMFGSCEKKFNDWSFSLSKKFSELELIVHLNREKVCERIVTGKRMVEKEVVIATGKKMVEEEIVEWKCSDATLLKGGDAIPELPESAKELAE